MGLYRHLLYKLYIKQEIATMSLEQKSLTCVIQKLVTSQGDSK